MAKISNHRQRFLKAGLGKRFGRQAVMNNLSQAIVTSLPTRAWLKKRTTRRTDNYRRKWKMGKDRTERASPHDVIEGAISKKKNEKR